MADDPTRPPPAPRFLTAAVALPRIQAIVANASTLWFSQIGYLAFITITLLSVRHIDFFSVTSRISLPLLGVTIPTETFFYIAPWLAAVLHVYFHLFLLKLWDAVAEAPPSVGTLPLGERVAPWLVVDWALRRRPDHAKATTHRPMNLLGSAVTGFLIWLATPILIVFFWWRSMPAHDARLTLAIAAALLVSLFASLRCWRRARRTLQRPGIMPRPDRAARGVGVLALWLLMLSAVPLVTVISILGAGWHNLPQAVVTYADRSWPSYWDQSPLVPINLINAQIAERSADWRDWDIARRRFRVTWCRDQGVPAQACERPKHPDQHKARRDWCTEGGLTDNADCDGRFTSIDETFEEEWQRERAAYRANIIGPDLGDRDLRRANADGAFLAGIDLSRARLEGANLFRANLEGAKLRLTRLNGAILINSDLRGADLDDAELRRAILINSKVDREYLRSIAFNHYGFSTRVRGDNEYWSTITTEANLSDAWLPGADLSQASLERANMFGAWLEGANLSDALLGGANLSTARLTNAQLERAQLQGADLSQARLERANIVEANLAAANLERARLREALLEGSQLWKANLQEADLFAANLKRTSLHEARLERADLRVAQLQGADLREAWLHGANLREAQLQGTLFIGAKLQSTVLEGAEFGASVAHATNLSSGLGLTQSQFAQVIGDGDTVLPLDAKTGEQLHVWNCWSEPPPTLDSLLRHWSVFLHDQLRAEWLCGERRYPRPEGDQPRRTGRPAAPDPLAD